jgi:glycerol uptake facilitator protein
MTMTPYVAELVGTMLLVILGDGVVANVVLSRTKGHGSGWIVITTGWGLAVAMAVYAVGRISGAHINPAVTLGLVSIGAFDAALAPGYVAAQLLGAFLGAGVVWLTYRPYFDATEDPAAVRAVFCTAPAIRSVAFSFVAEVVGTAVLVFGVLAIGANAGELRRGAVDLSAAFSTGLNPLLVGLLVWAIGLSLGGPTGYAINPARDLGPRLAHAALPLRAKGDSDWGYAWIPVAGPMVGGIAGAWLFRLLGL